MQSEILCAEVPAALRAIHGEERGQETIHDRSARGERLKNGREALLPPGVRTGPARRAWRRARMR
jgi:hypothetical protein